MISCNDLLTLGYKRRGEGTRWGSRFVKEEVLPNFHERSSPLSPLSVSLIIPQTRDAASVSWNTCVLPAELHSAVCVCIFLRVRCVSVWVSAHRRLPARRLFLDHLIYRLIRCSFSVAQCPHLYRDSVLLLLLFCYSLVHSSSCSVIPWFRTPAVPPWFLLRVQNNMTYLVNPKCNKEVEE